MNKMLSGFTDKILFTGSEWSFDSMARTYDAIEQIALNELELDVYPNQIEIISSEQMLDAYSSVGHPLMYQHWSFGKRFARDEELYRKGLSGLAYEIVINSNPCISYNMEENSMALQTLVMAHAAFGHNHFFKNNYLFKTWTDADSIHEYLAYAKAFVTSCEERYGLSEVEVLLDAAHALMAQGVFKYRRPAEMTAKQKKAKEQNRHNFERSLTTLDIWSDKTMTPRKPVLDISQSAEGNLGLPQENILYFLAEHSPILKQWQRDILNIVRNLSQYFYPQKQTKIMNEGCACFVHYHIINRLFETGHVSEGALLEMLHSHTNVIQQRSFDDPHFNDLNPYAIGFGMMMDIKRICENPTKEDHEWFPEIAGQDDWKNILKDAWANYRDESFILQFLSPRLMRKLRLFTVTDDAKKPEIEVTEIHNEQGYHNLRRSLARANDLANLEPDLQIVGADMQGNRELVLCHNVRDGIVLEENDRDEVLKHLKVLWGYEVTLNGVDNASGNQVYSATTAA